MTNNPLGNIKEQRQNEKVSDNNSIFFSCPICEKSLIEILIVRPNVKMTTNMSVICECGEKTFEKQIKGQYCLGSIKGIKIDNVKTDIVSADDNGVVQNVTVLIKKEEQE